MNFNAKCVDCGRFMRANDFVLGRCEVEPLSEFGPERIEWTCARCAIAAAARQGGDVQQAPGEAPQSGGDSRIAQPKGAA